MGHRSRLVATFLAVAFAAAGAGPGCGSKGGGGGGEDAITGFGTATLELIPTFECMSIRASFEGDRNENSVCRVEYRAAGDSTWRRGHDLWTDHNRKLCVGSVVYLSPGTEYEFRLTIEDPDGVPDPNTVNASEATWSETFPEGQTDTVTDSTTPVTIDAGGTETGYRVYAPASGNRAVIDVGTDHEEAMIVDADHVIIRDIDFVGGSKNAIRIVNDRHDIVIENCTFTRFGAVGKAQGPGTFPDERDNAAILVGNTWSGSGTARVIIQYNTFHDPNGGSNSWDDGHPTGPHAVFLLQTDGNHVIRYNHIFSSPDHWYNDCIGGGQNSSTTFGNVNRDTDIYGNIISHCWDDAIEVEGRNENCRVWGNHIESSHLAVASGAVTVGPLYVFRNIFIRSVVSESDPSARGTTFKCGYNDGTQGPQFTYHNTVTGPDEPRHAISASAGPVYNHTSRNNIFDVGGTVVYDNTESSTNSFDWDLVRDGASWDVGPDNYLNVVHGSPVFAASGPYGGSFGLFLDPTSPGYRSGTAVPNFSDGADGSPITDPDVGAFDDRFPPLRFGPNLE
jgi:hypothetical protein